MTEEIANLRTLIIELRPAALDDYGVAAAIESLAERTAARQGIVVDVHVDLAWEPGEETTRLVTELESTVYRLAQESLNNAVRHAGASRVDIELTELNGDICVSITDDGTGFDLNARATGLGLMGMRERATLAAGELDIETGPKGTMVRVRLPARRRVGAVVRGRRRSAGAADQGE